MWDRPACPGNPGILYFIHTCRVIVHLPEASRLSLLIFIFFIFSFIYWRDAGRTNWRPSFILIDGYSKTDHMFTEGYLDISNLQNWDSGFEFVSSGRLLLLSSRLLSFVVYCSAECVYLSVGSTIKEKLHVHGTDTTDWPPAGDTFAQANLSQKQTVTKFSSASTF